MIDCSRPAKCHGIFGWLFGHHYVPQVSTTYTGDAAKLHEGMRDAILLADNVGRKEETVSTVVSTYHGAVCKRCGDRILP